MTGTIPNGEDSPEPNSRIASHVISPWSRDIDNRFAIVVAGRNHIPIYLHHVYLFRRCI